MSAKDRVRILLADDHSLVAEGVQKLLELRYEVVGIVGNGRALLDQAAALRPDVIVADITMPEIDGLEATRRLCAAAPEVPVIILTMHDGTSHVKAAFEAGAAGYLIKSSAARELYRAIEEVRAGRPFVTSCVAGMVMGALLSPQSDSSASPDSELTVRESEVAKLVAGGLENVEIADRLCIAKATVRTHFLNILRKLELKNRVELTRYALSKGWVSLEEDTRNSAR